MSRRDMSRSGLRAGAAQGYFIVILSTVSVAATLLIAPILPKMATHFAADPNAQGKVLLALTVPALLVALSSALVGRIVDSYGRKVVLWVSLLAYSVCGIMPAFLDDLNLIILVRIGVGLAEAGIMTSSTALLGDYFKGNELEPWLVLQSATPSISAIIFLLIGGTLGEIDWRWTFAVYGLALLAVPVCLALIFEPVNDETAADEASAIAAAASARLPWHSLGPLYLIALGAAVLFFIVPIQMPFLLTERGVTSAQTIGIIGATGSVAIPVGSFLFRLVSHLRLSVILGMAFTLISLGFVLVVGNGRMPMTFVGVVIAGLGSGLVLPALLTAIMKHLEFAVRGRGTGGWQTCFFLGNFASPFVAMALTSGLGSLSRAFMLLAACAMISAFLCLFFAIAAHHGKSARPA